MESISKKILMASAVAGLMSLGLASPTLAEGHADSGHCYGVNKCKGTGACGGPGHSCAGNNACKGQGYLKIDKDTCLKIQGGRLTAKADNKG